MMKQKTPVIFGLSGCAVTKQESEFFAKANPFGYIIFKRNITDKEQLKALTDDLKQISGQDVHILIDQEGGRVARLHPPIAQTTYPASASFAQIAKEKGLKQAKEEVYKSYYSMGCELAKFGINVDCAPVADLLHEGADNVIGDRSFGPEIKVVVELCKEAIAGLRAAGVQPIVKHIPGHGRAGSDSHHSLPVVNEELAVLEKSDFAVFKELATVDPWAMTAHILYTKIDNEKCVSVSKKCIEYIRSNLGYDGKLIMSDAIEMKALGGSYKQKAFEVLEAGCDIVLHCTGVIEEMEEVLHGIQEYISEF